MPEQQDIRRKFASEHINNAVFYVPFAYLYQVRLGTPWKFLSWLFIYLMPCAFFGWMANCSGISVGAWLYALNFGCLALAIVTLYELGYIFNDTFAARREPMPSIRLYEINADYFYARTSLVVAVRLIIAAAALWLFVHIGLRFSPEELAPYLMRTLDSVLIIIPIFAVYNYWRGKWNVLLYPLLLFSRYLPFLLPYECSACQAVLLFMCVPCLSAIERFSMPKHRFPLVRHIIPSEESKTMFRVCYYIVLCAALAGLVYFKFLCSYKVLIPFVLLLLYRLCVAVLTRYHHPKNYLNG